MSVTTPWLNITGFKARSVMPPEDVDRLEAQYQGFLTTALADHQERIESRLRKRYAIPFADPVPLTAVRWLVSIVTALAYDRRGWNPSSQENERIGKAADTAEAEIKEAADSDAGLFDLPLRRDLPQSSGVSAGGPFGYSEASPYAWTDVQRDEVGNG